MIFTVYRTFDWCTEQFCRVEFIKQWARAEHKFITLLDKLEDIRNQEFNINI